MSTLDIYIAIIFLKNILGTKIKDILSYSYKKRGESVQNPKIKVAQFHFQGGHLQIFLKIIIEPTTISTVILKIIFPQKSLRALHFLRYSFFLNYMSPIFVQIIFSLFFLKVFCLLLFVFIPMVVVEKWGEFWRKEFRRRVITAAACESREKRLVVINNMGLIVH